MFELQKIDFFLHISQVQYIENILSWNAWKIVAQGTRQKGCLEPDVKNFSSLYI